MALPEKGRLLKIFIGESDRYEGVPLYKWIVKKARKEGLAGATVLRGMLGYGAHSRIHTTKILRLSEDLPVVIEIIDTPEKIEAFLPSIEQAVKEGLTTIEEVQIKFYRGMG
ncbi:MAG: DUF190 domain-containing protein [Desulfobacteraceae bacterium]